MNYPDYQCVQRPSECSRRRCGCGCCGNGAIGFLLLLFSLGLGLILGAVFYETITPATAAVIAFLAAIAAAIIATLIYCLCRRND